MRLIQILTIGLFAVSVWRWNPAAIAEENRKVAADVQVPSLPDEDLVKAYRHAAAQNVLAAVDPGIFPGYFSVCADGSGFGRGNSYPSLDGHQMSEALLWLGEVEVVKSNWDYVRSFQRPNGHLPLAILPSLAGQPIGSGDVQATVDANGGLYKHWVPGNDDIASWGVTSQDAPCQISEEGGIVWLVLPAISDASPCHFRVRREAD